MKLGRRYGGVALGRSQLRWFAIAALVATAAFAATLLYLEYGRPPTERTEVIVQRAATSVSMPVPNTNAGGLRGGTGTAESAGATPAIEAATASGRAVTARPTTTELLRPGTEAIEQLDVSLDGSATGQIAVTSRYTVTSGCQPLYADVYTSNAASWQRVFDASDSGMAYGPLLPPPDPSATSTNCFPKLRLFSGRTASDGGNALLVFGVAYADTSIRVVVLGWDGTTNAPVALFDRRTGPSGTVFRSADGDRLEIGEDLPLPPDVAAGSLGRFTQVIGLTGGVPAVVSRRLAPNCDRGHISGVAGAAMGSAPERVVLDCSSGSKVAAALAGSFALTPDGVQWVDVREGDNVQVQYDAASLEPDDMTSALPRVASLNDYTAASRSRQRERSAKPAAGTRTSTRPPAAGPAAPAPRPTVQRQAAPQASGAPAASGGEAPPARTSGAPAAQSQPPAAPPAQSQPIQQATRQPAAPRPIATAPAPAVSPPPAPRGLPSNGPPPAPR